MKIIVAITLLLQTIGLLRFGAALDPSVQNVSESARNFTVGNTKIVGGVTVTDRSKFAYQAALTSTRGYFCGGSILDSQHILTAAHCVYEAKASELEVAVGHLIKDSPTRIRVKVAHIFSHEKYSNVTLDNDIAVLRLKSNLTMDNYIQPIKLATSVPPDNAVCTVSGWGTTSQGGQVSNTLRKVDINIVNVNICNTAYSNMITSNMICAAALSKDSCQGDSGGPLVHNGTLIGIVSFGNGCAKPFFPGVYAKVSAYQKWIETQIGRSSASNVLINMYLLFIAFSCMFIKF